MCKGRLDLCVCNRKVGRRDKVSNALVYVQGETGATRTLGEAEIGSADAYLPRPREILSSQSLTASPAAVPTTPGFIDILPRLMSSYVYTRKDLSAPLPKVVGRFL